MIETFIEAMWWDKNNNKPHNVFIVGDTSTRLNLGWFIKKGNEYQLTQAGDTAYKTYLDNKC